MKKVFFLSFVFILIPILVCGCNNNDISKESAVDLEGVCTEYESNEICPHDHLYVEETMNNVFGNIDDVTTAKKSLEYSYLVMFETIETNSTILVHGVDLPSSCVSHIFHSEHYAALPFTAIMEALGAVVEMKEDATAIITYKGNDYILDIKEPSLINTNDNDDYMMGLGGNTHPPYFGYTGTEFMIDSDYLRYILSKWNLTLNIDYDNSIVVIDHKAERAENDTMSSENNNE